MKKRYLAPPHGVGGGGLAARAFLEHLILQAAGQYHHAILLGVLGKVALALGPGGLALLGPLGVDARLLLGEVLRNERLRLAVGHLKVVAVYHVVDGCRKVVCFKTLDPHLRQLAPYAQSQGVAQFVHFYLLYVYEFRLMCFLKACKDTIFIRFGYNISRKITIFVHC